MTSELSAEQQAWPTWLDGWLDYPHGLIHEQRARELARYALCTREALEAAGARLADAENALRTVRLEIVDSVFCIQTADDGSDDCADVEQCLMHGVIAIIDTVLPPPPEASPRSSPGPSCSAPCSAGTPQCGPEGQ